MFLLFDGVCLLKRSYMEICVRNYPEFSARYSQSSRPWKEQDLAVNQGFRPYALYILHLRRQRIFFSTVLSLVSFTWCVFSSLVFIPFSRSLDELYAFSFFFFVCVFWFLLIFYCILQSKQAITGDAVLLKFEKAKVALINSLKRVEDIVPSSIGSQVLFFFLIFTSLHIVSL